MTMNKGAEEEQGTLRPTTLLSPLAKARHGGADLRKSNPEAASDELEALSRLLARRAARLHRRNLGGSPLAISLPLVFIAMLLLAALAMFHMLGAR